MTVDDKTAEEMDKLSDEIRVWADNYAKENGWRLNGEDKQLTAVIRGLARNTLKFGEQYCPCRIRSGDKEKDSEIICPCIFHKDEIEGDGNCHCRFFFSKGN